MKAKQIYELFVKLGIDNDPREKAEIEKKLAKINERYEKFDKKEKAEFDTDKLWNPYDDTRFLTGDENAEVREVLVGIDMETAEVLMADRLNQKGAKIDLVISHHPEGKALAALDKVMHVQADILANYGVPINVAEGILAPRITEISRAVAPANHNRGVDAAKLLGLSFMCSHTVADNMVHTFVEKYLAKKTLDTVDDVVNALEEITEYAEGKKNGAGPRIFVGSGDARAGKVAVTDMTGGTSGSKDIYEKMANAGIGTIIGMHMGEEHKKEAEKHHINVVIAGHMASDSLGMNLLLDEIEKKGVKVIPTSGLIRVKRKTISDK